MIRQQRAAFQGNERFAVEAEIGSGGMGVVYRALDRERGSVVALKLLRKVNPMALYRFKREFRALADVSHANLVTLYELFAEADRWFFTMELVEGRLLLDQIRGERVRPVAPTLSMDEYAPGAPFEATESTNRPFADAPRHVPAPPLEDGPQLQRLRAALPQLAEGVLALHDAGHLHRDIKPSNVMVTPQGRVVLLDFGVITGLEQQRVGRIDDPNIVGTPSYMAPEQAAGRPLSEASDWYSVGVVLFESLTGHRPSARLRLLDAQDNASAVAEALDAFAPEAPTELLVLCEELLARDPSARPRGPEVLARLIGAPAGRRRAVVRPPAAVLIGRGRHLSAMEDALAAARSGKQTTLLVHGRSGIGKTALLQYFLAGVEGTGQALVLSGRCFERESVPHKALDALVDALATELVGFPEDALAEALPADAAVLARLFPVLRRVPALAERVKTGPEREPLDPLALRQRGYEALRALLGWLARRRPVVMAIDDVQWGDADSAAVLAEALRAPDAPPVLLVLGYRTEEAESSPFLRRLWAGVRATPDELEIGPLSPLESRDLAEVLLSRAGAAGLLNIDGIAREAQGSPFFVGELVRFLVESDSVEGYHWVSQGVRLEQVLRTRVSDLPDPARRLLEAAAVAGRPQPQGLVCRAAGLDADESVAAVALLRSRSLVRTRGPRDEDAIEVYHDRIREAALAEAGAVAIAAYHRDMAAALAGQPSADPEALAVHWEGAGEPRRAAEHYEEAAALAAEALAFGRAASLLRRSIALHPRQGPAGAVLRAQLGDALAKAGRGAEAAEALLEAAELAGPDERIEHTMGASEQLLRSGHIDEGLALLAPVLEAIGLPLPTTPWRQRVGLLVARRAVVARLREPESGSAAAPVSPSELRRLRLCRSTASTLGMCDPMLGAYFQARHLVMALAAGEPREIARGLAIEASYASLRGFSEEPRARELIVRSRALAEQVRDPLALAWSQTAESLLDFATERWSAALAGLTRSLPLMRDGLVGGAYEAHGLEMFRVFALYYAGELGELGRRVPALLHSARGRGDLYALTDLQSGLANLAWLVAGDVPAARAAADDAAERWRPEVFQLQHYWDIVARTHIELYAGRPREAHELVTERWRELSRSHLLRIHMIRVEALHLRARCAVALAGTGHARAARLARRDAKRLARIGTPTSVALAVLIEAGLDAALGDGAVAAAGFERAVALADAAGLHLFAAAARMRAGKLRGGSDGDARAAEAEAGLRAQSVASPERMTALLAP